jgi:hypothetical protein
VPTRSQYSKAESRCGSRGRTSKQTLSEEAREERSRDGQFLHFSHTMEDQLGLLTSTGFAITGFYEDRRPDWDGNPIRHYLPSYYIVRAERH